MAKGHLEYQKFLAGARLTYKQAVLAQCFTCGGLDTDPQDCKGIDCPLYQYMPYRLDRQKKEVSEEKRKKLADNLKRARQAKQK